jgi:hypothetical protein
MGPDLRRSPALVSLLIGKSVINKWLAYGVLAVGAVLTAVAVWWPQPLPTPAAVPVPAAPKLSAPPEAVDAQWAAIPTHPMPKVLSRTVVVSPGLPAPAKDGLAPIIKPWLADAWLTHQSVVEMNGFANSEWSVNLSSAAASLNGTTWDAVFIAFDAPGLCGSGGCTTHILHRTDQGWAEVGSLFGCDKIELLSTKTQGLRDIRYADCPSQQEYVFRFDGRGYVER